MERLIILIVLFVLWNVFRAIKSAADKSKQTSYRQPRPPQRDQAQFPQRQMQRHEMPSRGPSTVSRRQPQVSRREQPPSTDDTMSDMERLFAEAMERKRGIEHRPDRGRPRGATPRPVQRLPEPEPELDDWIPAAPESETDPWIPARPEPQRKIRSGQVHVARPRRREVAEPAAEAPTPPPAHAERQKRARAGRHVARREPADTIPIIGSLSIDDVRRGVIIAEVLGPPKGLGDIESHVI